MTVCGKDSFASADGPRNKRNSKQITGPYRPTGFCFKEEIETKNLRKNDGELQKKKKK